MTSILCGTAMALWVAGTTELAQLRPPARTMVSSIGQETPMESLRGTHGSVLFFLSTECPISNGYIPTINRLVKEYRGKGIEFAGVNPNAGQGIKDIELHRIRFDLKITVVKDPGAGLTKLLGVTHCPTVLVFDSTGKAVYRGRIDDRYPKRGGAPKQVIHKHDLEDVLRALADATSVDPGETDVVGCPVVEDPVENKEPGDSAITFTRDIADILQANCQECHRPGGIGPFSLVTYEETVLWAPDVKAFTQDRSMPPWKLVSAHGEFKNDRRMNNQDIETIAKWVDAGCPKGDAAESPPPKEFVDGWRVGTPDMILTPAEPYTLAGEGPDEYRHFVLPTNLDEDVYVSAMEVLPGNPRVVHHVIAFLDPFGTSEKLDAASPGPGYVTAGGTPGFIPPGALGGWAPGNVSGYLPDGVARIVPKGSRIVLQIHYHRSGKDETDLTQVGLYFSKEKPKRLLRDIAITPFSALPSLQIPLLSKGIPAGDARYTIRQTGWVPEDIELLSVRPHMHLIGKEMKVTATLPDGTVKQVVHIDNWDFNWQEAYYYAEPLHLPKNTRLEMESVFDNSAANPANPFNPPKEVQWGEETTNEMAFCFLELVPTREAVSDRDLRLESVTDFIKNWVTYQLRGPKNSRRPLFSAGR